MIKYSIFIEYYNRKYDLIFTLDNSAIWRNLQGKNTKKIDKDISQLKKAGQTEIYKCRRYFR